MINFVGDIEINLGTTPQCCMLHMKYSFYMKYPGYSFSNIFINVILKIAHVSKSEWQMVLTMQVYLKSALIRRDKNSHIQHDCLH